VKNTITAILITIFYILFPINSTYAQYHADSDVTGNINVMLGKKDVDNSDWNPITYLHEGAISLDIKEYSWPISLCTAYYVGTHSKSVDLYGYDVDLELTTKELDLGIKKIFSNESGFNFSLSSGVSAISVETLMSVDGIGDYVQDDNVIGLWLGSEVYYTICNVFNVGMNFKYSAAQADFGSGSSVNVGGIHYGLLLGYHF
jgi:hypothetical protein